MTHNLGFKPGAGTILGGEHSYLCVNSAVTNEEFALISLPYTLINS